MKKFIAALFVFAGAQLFAVSSSNAQFRTENESSEPKLNTVDAMKGGDSFFSRIFDPSRFSMHQSYSMSVASSSVGSYGLSMFTNTFSYKASDDLLISADLSAVYSPFNSFGGNIGQNFGKNVNGVYLTSARLDWKLSENTSMRIEYLGGPQNNLYGGFGGYPYGYGGYGLQQTPVVSNPTPSNSPAILTTARKHTSEMATH